MNHTPGPWTVAKRIVGKHPATVVLDAEQNEVCEVYASSALVAAAPDLLAALQHALDRFESIPAHQDEAGIYRHAAAIAKAAIAKAIGE